MSRSRGLQWTRRMRLRALCDTRSERCHARQQHFPTRVPFYGVKGTLCRSEAWWHHATGGVLFVAAVFPFCSSPLAPLLLSTAIPVSLRAFFSRSHPLPLLLPFSLSSLFSPPSPFPTSSVCSPSSPYFTHFPPLPSLQSRPFLPISPHIVTLFFSFPSPFHRLFSRPINPCTYTTPWRGDVAAVAAGGHFSY